MRTISVLSLLAGLLLATVANAQTTSGIVSANETWSGTITLTGDVVCTSGTITIQPGTIVKFATSNDNVIYGSSTAIFLTAQGNGSLSAQGTVGSVITFTSAALTPVAGSWGKIAFQNLNNSAANILRYCVIEYAQNGVNINNTGTAPAAPTIDHVIIRNTSMSGIFGGALAAPVISNCTISNTGSGIFLSGTGTASITNTVIYHVPTGIILAGGTDGLLNTTIDHCTIYDVDMNLTTAPTWWTGYSIFCTNNTGVATITNNIIAKYSLNGLNNKAPAGWTVTEDHNCFYDDGGLGPIGSAGVADGTDITGDPMFNDAASGDFTLDPGSPAIGLGAQVGIRDFRPTLACLAAAGLDIRTTLNQLMVVSRNAKAISLSISDLQGRQIWSGSGSQLTWSGSRSGVYLYTIRANGQVFGNSIVVAR
jgi:hypothetical protein